MSDRDQLVRMAVERHFIEWAYNEKVENALCLGASYERNVDLLIEKVSFARSAVEAELKTFPEQQLRYAAGLDGAILDVHLEQKLSKLCSDARGYLPSYSRYELISIGMYPDELADYSHWAMRDQFDSHDFVWLSIGLEPDERLVKYLGQAQDTVRPPKLDATLKKEAERRLALITTAQKLDPILKHVKIELAYEWYNTVELDAPIGFQNALKIGWERLQKASKAVIEDTPYANDKAPDPRAIRTLSQIIAAMAIDGYGFDPNSKRSAIPKEIESACDTFGISVTKETILKYIRLGLKDADIGN
ncbi:hypothetical protein EDD53_0259 [Pacificibacter maritimus]|uniref:Uncharacterized protein n=1 Tax=Pacificibacter maritimus TaxID=762213 RepID=A0A3N4UR65_9RHOB|nr:hypothetical protein [Pacificibacter maritimus]RPE71145.1 hypothetical protein EDD53_0259 [Pacificibacter maritimus]